MVFRKMTLPYPILNSYRYELVAVVFLEENLLRELTAQSSRYLSLEISYLGRQQKYFIHTSPCAPQCFFKGLDFRVEVFKGEIFFITSARTILGETSGFPLY